MKTKSQERSFATIARRAAALSEVADDLWWWAGERDGRDRVVRAARKAAKLAADILARAERLVPEEKKRK